MHSPLLFSVTFITRLSCHSLFDSRVVGVDGPPAGRPPLDGLHGGGVQGLLLGHGPLLIALALGALHLPLPLRLVHVVNPEQQTVVHDLKALQHLSRGQEVSGD